MKYELLAPAGNFEKLKMAIIYGADAVYLGGQDYGLRANADNFGIDQLKQAIEFVHSRGKRLYITMNMIPHNNDLVGMPEYIEKISQLGVDAIIVSDPAVFSIVREVNPQMEIHISTQANNTNWRSAKFWYDNGATRIILARELSLTEIREIHERVPGVELEVFIHGAMCISYSGRCLLSNYMTGRDSNRGACAHPCRWKYSLMEEKRPGKYYPVFENERGTFIFNSNDLCMIEHISELMNSGIASFKIEGRMKSSYYTATVTGAYRRAIDSYLSNPDKYEFNPEYLEEVSKVSHRNFTTGFFFGKPDENDQNYSSSSYIRDYDFVGLVTEYDEKTQIGKVEQRNRMFKGEEIEVVVPGRPYFAQKIEIMEDEERQPIDVAPHPQMVVYIRFDKPVTEDTILRKKSK